MSSEQRVVLVTGVGGNVGQGILRIIRSSFPEIRLIATDVGRVTAGHHFCDAFYQVPYAYDSGFRAAFLQIPGLEKVDLIIPSTDYEALYLSSFASELPAVIASSPKCIRTCLDKWTTWTVLSSAGVPFAESCLPSQYDGTWGGVVVKPREGRGSRDVFFDPENVSDFEDTFVVQRRSFGVEITTSFYVCRNGELRGPITFTRSLRDGMTERCEVTFTYEEKLQSLIEKTVHALNIVGPCNIQSIVDEGGAVVPFEINCRYSGTSSVRSQLGFEDVRYGIQEYLLGEEPSRATVVPGCAVRLMVDVVYPGQSLDNLQPGNGKSHLF